MVRRDRRPKHELRARVDNDSVGLGLPKLRLHALSQLDFFANELPLLVKVQLGNDGRGVALLITPPRGQHAMQARRVI